MNAKIYTLDAYQEFDSAYWGMGSASDGKVYFALCTHKIGKSAVMLSLDPGTGLVSTVLNIADVLTDGPHGKIHTPIIEGQDSKLYFGTHFAYPDGIPQDVDYAGGHFMSYEPATKDVVDYGIAASNEGILTIALDKKNSQAYMLTVPSGLLIKCDINKKALQVLGKIPSNGSICRTLAVDKRGNVYGSYEDNGLFVYEKNVDKIKYIDDYFPDDEAAEWTSESRGGVNKIGRKLWRCISYDEASDRMHGILASSSQLFMIDCETIKLTLHDPLVPSRYKSAQDIYPTLSFIKDKKSLFYVPADGLFDYCRSENIEEWSTLMAVDKESMEVVELGELESIDGRRVYGVAGATTQDDKLYFIGAIEDLAHENNSPLLVIQEKSFRASPHLPVKHVE